MSENVVASKILAQAKLTAKSILKNAQTDCKNLQKNADEFAIQRKKFYDQKLNEKLLDAQKSSAVALEIEAKKTEIFHKRKVLDDLHKAVCEDFLNMPEQKLAGFVQTFLQKNASAGDVVKINFFGITPAKAKQMEVVKSLKLKVEKGKDVGIVIEQISCNKTFLLDEVVSCVIENNQKALCDQLFD